MKSIIWTIPTNKLTDIIKESPSYAEALRKLGLKQGATTIKLRKRMDYDSIDYNHLKDGQGKLWNKGKQFLSKEDVVKEYFIENSSIDRQSIKKYIMRFNLLTHDKCNICNLIPIWNNKPLTLILDHINGIRNDDRIKNLRLICPNCNSQLETTCKKGNTKRIQLNSRQLIKSLKEGKSIRRFLIDNGLSDGQNYGRIKSLFSSI